uniref:Putative mediator of RNA polymerase II transcription subunit 16 n=1 Tax=Anthurium amnicola TaxID=1678845 RepID=A0A1D1ZCV0_9ARAE
MSSAKAAVASTPINAPPISKDAGVDQTAAAAVEGDRDRPAEADSDGGADGAGGGGGGAAVKREPEDRPMEDADGASTSSVPPATVFRIRLKQPPSSLRHKMSVPELCRNFSAVAWCGSLNVIACASETCARIPSSNINPPFWIPIHIVNPERPTECAVFNVVADSPRDSVQFIEWSPKSCPRALLIANIHGRITIWTQPSHGPANLIRDASCWQREHEWRQDLAVVTKWLSGMSPYRWLPSNSSGPANPKSTFEEKFLSQQPQNSARWPNFLCVCSVFSSGSLQLHWSQWPPTQGGTAKWFATSKGLLGAGPSGIMAADAIITDAGNMHVAGVPLVNPSTVVVWEVTPGPGNAFLATAKISTGSGVPSSLSPCWAGFAPLAAYLFHWQECLLSEGKQSKKQIDQEFSDAVSLHCSPVSNFSAYVSPEAAAQSATTTTWGSGVTAVAFDPTRGGSVISVVIVEGQYMSPYDPDEGPSITGWRVQCWDSSLQTVVLHPIFGNPASSFGGQPPMQTVWVMRVNKSIPPTDDLKSSQANSRVPNISDEQTSSESSAEKTKRLSFDPYDLPSDIRTLAQIVYSAHGSEVAVAFLRGGVHIFSGPSFTPLDSYQINVGSTIGAPAFSSTSCCLSSAWHDTRKDCTTLKIIRVLPPAMPSTQVKINSASWERAIVDRFWWSLLVGVDWWDAVGCTHSAAEDTIVSLNSVIAVLDADFHSLPSIQHRQQYGPCLDRIKCRLLEGTNAQDVRALVLDMQARLLLDMLGKGIESALVNPATLLPEPWQASSETLSGIDADKMVVEPTLVPSIQAYVDAVLDLASHFITRLRRYASFCRTLASHAVTSASAGSARNMATNPSHSSASPSASQGSQSGGPSTTGSSQMQAWVQGAIAKISSTADGVSSATANPMSGPSPFMPISINTGTFPGTPAVRLIGDCHFLHRLCQLLLFCLIFRRRQSRFISTVQKNPDSNLPKPQAITGAKVEENSTGTRPALGVPRSEEGQIGRPGQVILGTKGLEDGPAGRSLRLGSGNAGQGYTSEEVKVLFLILVDLCRRTAALAHPLPVSQVGANNIIIRLHYIDGNYTVLPEVVEASLGPHMQNMPRPRGADAAGLLLRELELHPPAEEWHRRNMFGGPWSDPEDLCPLDDSHNQNASSSYDARGFNSSIACDNYHGAQGIWPRKRRLSERDAAFGLKTSVGLGSYLGIMGSRRDVVTALWKTGLEGIWYKCIRCLRQTCAFESPGSTNPTSNEREAWWISRWAYGCPMCGGSWVRVV